MRSSDALVELTLDLRSTPPDKVLPRLFGALDRVSPDVTLLVLLRDTPEYVGVTASAHQALRTRGYFSDMARLPAPGGQRLRVQRRRERDWRQGALRADQTGAAEQAYAPPPSEERIPEDDPSTPPPDATPPAGAG